MWYFGSNESRPDADGRQKSRAGRSLCTVALAAGILGLVSRPCAGQQAAVRGVDPTRPSAPIERLGADRLRVGNIQIDTAKKEVVVRGTVNDALTLEFVANPKGGFKAYESALELDTDAVNFNLALILIGLDPARAVPARTHLDVTPPQGDPVEVWVAWEANGRQMRVRAEQLIYNVQTKQTLSEGPWVYTGSVFSSDNNAYLADLEGSLIGFVHTPAPVIESPRPLNPGDYGANRLNPNLNLKPGTAVTLTVRALPRDGK